MHSFNFAEQVAAEINNQKQLHGDRERELELWLIILGEEIGELVEAIETDIHSDIHIEAIQVAACAVSATRERISPENCGVFSFTIRSTNYEQEIRRLMKFYGLGCRCILENKLDKFNEVMFGILETIKTLIHRNLYE